MAALHDALATLGPTDFSSVPQDTEALAAYLESAFKSARTIVDSVPFPNPSDASNRSTDSSSPAAPDLLDPENAPLQKEWGKPVKLNSKENPLDVTAYKLAGKDGKGAWFARRSVHEGMGFKRWRLGLEREFPETLLVKGGPGEGNIRGIGAESRVERKTIPGVGTEEVYLLTAQFPGPSSPRDFVTLFLTSSTALSSGTEQAITDSTLKSTPRHYMVISRPCIHPDTPPRAGFVRGQYESVEFIRELPRRPKRSVSAINLTTQHRDSEALDKEARKKMARSEADALQRDAQSDAHEVQEARRRGQTISFAGSRGISAKGEKIDSTEEDEGGEFNPVEWIMITRSDPGGNVPRFMVERGTPAGIATDAGRWHEWAMKKEHSQEVVEAFDRGPEEEVDTTHFTAERSQPKSGSAGHDMNDESRAKPEEAAKRNGLNRESSLVQETQSEGLMASMTNVAMSSIESYAPQAVIDRLPGHTASSIAQEHTPNGTRSLQNPASSPSNSTNASFVSFSSVESQVDAASMGSPPSQRKVAKEKQTPEEREFARHQERKRALEEKLAKSKEKETKDKEELTTREEQRIKKAEEKHAKEMAKQEERYSKQVAKLKAKKQKNEEKDEKLRLSKEKEELRQQLESVKRERDLLIDHVGALQRENTSLVSRLGKIDEGKDLLKEVKAEILQGKRSRGSSTKSRPGTPERTTEATVLGKEVHSRSGS